MNAVKKQSIIHLLQSLFGIVLIISLFTPIRTEAKSRQITLNWLGKRPPSLAVGVSWGCLFQKENIKRIKLLL